MKSLLTITGLIEGATGLILAVAPGLFVSILLGTSLTDPGAVIIARLAGAALMTIAIACWLSRNDTHSTVMVKVVLLYNILAAMLLIYAVFGEDISGSGLWPAVLLHIGLLVWCATALRKRVQAFV